MIWTIIIVSPLIACVLGLIFVSEHKHENIWFTCLIGMVAFGIGASVLLACIISEHTMIDKKVAKLRARREALVYQMENGLYLGDALGEFNSDIISGRYNHENPWTSWLTGDYYYEVDPIPLGEKEE